ncbi:MAG: hypothetical protein Q8Q49_05600 [bacterium]|nr:hypothetical protein [bacterium]
MSKDLQKRLNAQVTLFITSLQEYNKKRQSRQPAENYRFLRDFYVRFFADRNKRATEIESTQYAEVKTLANMQFSAPTLWDLCMDGRVLAILVNGASSGVGSSLRVPGGILREFVRGTDGNLKLIESSNFAKLLERAFYRYGTDTIYEVFDSHIGCSARKAEELAHGYNALDSGLFADVVHKQEMGMATNDFVRRKFGHKKRAVTIQTSFDPHTGYIFMGLETKKALSYAEKHGKLFTTEILEDLLQSGTIISAAALAGGDKIGSIFQSHLFDLDWRGNYIESAKSFWKNIASMKKNVLPMITPQLIVMYPNLNRSKEGREEIEERAVLFLTNAYSGFLNNKHGYSLSGPHKSSEHYPYGVHREEGVKVSEGGYPPYAISMFVVFSLDKKNLPAHIELASTLVRNNRREGRVFDRSGTFKDPVRFSEAPVPVVIQGVVRDTVANQEWEEATQIDWSDLPSNWDSMNASDFYTYLQSKGQISIALANGINRLREKMTVLYDPDNPTSSHLVEHYKVALPVIVGKNRRNYFIVPFVKLGFA